MLHEECQNAKIIIYDEKEGLSDPDIQKNKGQCLESEKNDGLKDNIPVETGRQSSFPANARKYQDYINNQSLGKPSDETKSRLKLGAANPTLICKVKRMQEVTHILALVSFIPGLVLLAATPCMVIPIFVFPTGNKSLFVAFMLAGWLASLMLIAIGTIITNLHWYYDPQDERMRCTLRCNQRMKFPFWRSSFSYQPFDDVI